MDKQAVVAILEFYKNIDEEILLRKKAAAELEERYYSPLGCVAYDGMPKGQGGVARPTENTVLNVPAWVSSDLRNLQREQRKLYRLKTAIRQELNRLPYIQKAVIAMFYLDGLQWVRIAARIHYSERHCKNIRDCALAALARRFSDNKTIAGYVFPK